jgi:hypothetical protein
LNNGYQNNGHKLFSYTSNAIFLSVIFFRRKIWRPFCKSSSDDRITIILVQELLSLLVAVVVVVVEVWHNAEMLFVAVTIGEDQTESA